MKVESKDVAMDELDDPEGFPRRDLRASAAIAEIARGNFARELVLEGETLATCNPSRLLGGRRSLRMLYDPNVKRGHTFRIVD